VAEASGVVVSLAWSLSTEIRGRHCSTWSGGLSCAASFVRGASIKELMRRAGLARNTIRAALRSDALPAFRCPERPSKLDPFKDEIHQLLKDDPRLSGVRMRELIGRSASKGKTIIDDYL
jgi:hypothetical protein